MRVLQVGGGASGPLVGRLLADQGADVVVVRQPTDLPTPWPGVDRGKREVAGPVEPWAERADVWIDGSGLEHRTAHPATVRCRIVGGDGLPAEEGPVGARTGLYEVPLGRAPRFHTLPLATTLGALWAVNGVLAALIARRRDGRGQDVDVALTDVGAATHELLALFTDRPPLAWNPLQWAGTPFIGPYATTDGVLYVHLALRSHLERFLERLGTQGDPLRAVLSEQTARDPGSVGSVREAARIRRVLTGLFATRSADAWEAVLAGAGCCAVRVRTPEEWRSSAHALASGLVTPEGPGPAVRVERVGGRSRSGRADVWPVLPEPWGDDRRPPLAGIDVLDLSQVIAGPVAGRTLAELGARVVRIDNPWFRPAFVDAFHALFDRGKQGVWLDLKHPGGRADLARLVGGLQPTVLLQNFRPGRAGGLGLDELSVPVRVSLTAFGDTGPWGDWPGWEQTAQAACGVQSDYGRGRPELFPSPVHDLGTGLLGAYGALLGLYAGQGTVSTSLAAFSTWLQAPRLFGGELPVDGWRRDGGWGFHGRGATVPRVRPAEVLRASRLVRRAALEGVGDLTLIDAPLRLGRSPMTHGDPRPRGADTAAWLGRDVPPEPRSGGTRVGWWADRARWAAWAALTR